MMQVVQEGGRILYLKAKNTVELMEWYERSCHINFISELQACYPIESNSLYWAAKD